jgi:hypothetical protein
MPIAAAFIDGFLLMGYCDSLAQMSDVKAILDANNAPPECDQRDLQLAQARSWSRAMGRCRIWCRFL